VHIKDIRQNVRDYGKRGPFSPYTSRAQVSGSESRKRYADSVTRLGQGKEANKHHAQPFHTDRCDILSMYAYDVAPSGGESLLASNATIYNEIAATRPDIIHTLAKDDWIFDE
jgi:hypothetical protein